MVSQTQQKVARHLAFIEKPEEGKATECRLWLQAEYRLHKSFVKHLWSAHAADQEWEINFVWPKIVPSRRCPLVRGLDKGGFTVLVFALWYMTVP